MMFPKDGNYLCRKCGNKIPIKNNAKNFVSTAMIDDREVVVLEGEQISGLPTTSAKCPECGNNTASWWLRQLRSADESETILRPGGSGSSGLQTSPKPAS